MAGAGKAIGSHITVPRPNKNVLNIFLRLDLQIHIPVNTAVGQVIDHIAKRRHILSFPAVHLHDDPVLTSIVYIICYICGKRRIAAKMPRHQLSINKHLRHMGHALKCEQQPLPQKRLGNSQHPHITANRLIIVFVKINIW